VISENGFMHAFDPLSNNALVRRYVASLRGSTEGFPSRIHRADEMFTYNMRILRGQADASAMLYYLTGWQIFEAIRRIAEWRFGGLANVPSFLDFASGYGRVTRWLVPLLDPRHLTVSEIHPDAVRFQRDYFGVDGVVSSPQPPAGRPDRDFAFIMATSFFTHVPDSSFQRWLGFLLGLVAPLGVLAFSTMAANPVHGHRDGAAGITFHPASESSRLDTSAYGTTYVTEQYVDRAIADSGGHWTVSRLRRGIGGLQDLYVLVRAGEPTAAVLQAACFPWGDTDTYEIRPGGRLAAQGWVCVEQGASPVSRVELFVNDQLTELCALTPAGDCRWTWALETDPRKLEPDDVLSVRARTQDGLVNMIALASLRTHPPSRR
jgi:SAM-dependent methyltransferase